jgi:diguanylate cyclase (GGDEF)-like protein
MPWPSVFFARELGARPPRRFLVLSAALVLGIAGADWQIIAMQRASAIADFKTAASNLALGFSNQTYHAFTAADAPLHDIEQLLAAHPAASAEDIAETLRGKATYDRLVQRLLSLPGISALAIADADGRLAATTGGWPPPAEDMSQQPFFRQLVRRDAGEAFVGKPQRDPATGQWTSLLARRIDGRGGSFAGVLLADMSLAAIEDIYRWGLPLRRRLTLLQSDGTILVRYPPEPAVIGRKVPDGAPWYAAAAAGGGAYVARGYFDAIPVVTAVRPVRDLPLLAEASITQAEVLAGWRRERIWMIAGGFAASAAAVLLVRLFGLQLQRLAVRNTQLDEARRQLDVAISNISQGICLFDGQQRLLVCNKRFGEIYGLASGVTEPGVSFSEILDHWFAAGDGPANLPRQDLLTSQDAILRGTERQHSSFTMKDGRTVTIEQQPLPDGGWVSTHEDITSRRLAEERISYLAKHDMLTGLPNRSMLLERINEARPGAGRGQCFALMFLDLDRFKSVNDTLGHAAGDELLQSVASRLRETVREGDTVARLGGDEFVVLQANVRTPGQAANLAERIIGVVAEPYEIGVNEVVIGVSIGIDIAATDRISAEILMKNADMALYIAKGEGRGMFRFFEPDMDANVQNRHALERDLRCALERGEFMLYYQPIVTAPSGRPHGYEALLRWNHPVRGLVAPRDFIPMAEETGLIIPIGEWVVRQACRDAAHWRADMHVSVNLSPIQFRSINLVDMVRDAMAEAGLPAGRLELEITESVLLHSNHRNLAVMHEFHASGIGIVMDDFGVGYSSLNYLRQFPFARIKIDRCFVQDLGIRRDAVCVVRAILGLCRDLDIRTIAEGVETEEQMAILLAEGCTDMQGYLFSRPKPAALIDALSGGTSPAHAM